MMRLSYVLTAALVPLFFMASAYGAETGAARTAEEVNVPYRKHHDTHFGHDHYYPDRGAIVREPPKGSVTVNYAGLTYRFHDGVWFEPRGPAFMVVAPPIGVIVPSLPNFSTVLARGGKTLLYSNDTFYLPRPDVGGYEVVNDPSEADEEETAEPTALVGGVVPSSTAGVPTSATSTAISSTAMKGTEAVDVPTASVPTAPAMASSGSGASSALPMAGGSSAATAAAAASPPSASAADVARASKVYVYPKNGQNADQQARDRYDCYRFAVGQSGFDPIRSSGSTPAPEVRSDYERAQGVCLDARGYAVR